MRGIAIVGTGLCLGLAAIPDARAADATPAPQVRLPDPVIPGRPNLVSEFRIGGSAQEPGGPEEGSANITGEILFAKPFTAADLFTSYFIPRPHLGGSVNLRGDTSFAYAGLTWTYDLTSWLFVEGSFGGAVHTGNTESSKGRVGLNENALGCSPLFRESGSVGVRLSTNWSLIATIEHMSNAGLCAQNRGLTNVGARVGYTF
ncbi:MAG TPA: acyloxyacyl hydrolase [Microvirga sp.]|jgi:hypothetical protein|nr:acyloxyacyl hydrolase [Microvirga sp.]